MNSGYLCHANLYSEWEGQPRGQEGAGVQAAVKEGDVVVRLPLRPLSSHAPLRSR